MLLSLCVVETICGTPQDGLHFKLQLGKALRFSA
jgi:hypothetical protein